MVTPKLPSCGASVDVGAQARQGPDAETLPHRILVGDIVVRRALQKPATRSFCASDSLPQKLVTVTRGSQTSAVMSVGNWGMTVCLLSR